MNNGKKWKETRIRLGLTQKEMGELCEVSSATIQRLENGKEIGEKSMYKIVSRVFFFISIVAMPLLKESEKYDDIIAIMNDPPWSSELITKVASDMVRETTVFTSINKMAQEAYISANRCCCENNI